MSLLESAAECCPTSIIVIDAKGIIREVNKTSLELFGYEQSELIGEAVEILVPSDIKSQHHQHVAQFLKDPSHRQMGNGSDLLGVTKDGKLLNLEIGLSFFENQGERFAVANVVNISNEFRMKKLLNRTHEVARIGSWTVDIELQKCLWSKVTYQIHELDPATEVFVEDGINFYAPEHQQLIRDCVERGIRDQKSWDVELKIRTTKGKEIWVHAIGAPVIEAGKVVGLEGTFQDIHERKLLELKNTENEKKLRQSNEDLDEFAYIVSHDLKEPLRGMRNLSQFLIEDHSRVLDKEGIDFLQTIKKLGTRLESYLDSLLFYSRLGRQDLAYGPCDLNRLVADVQLSHMDISNKEVQIKVPDHLPKIDCDALKLTQVIGNLIQNGIRYNRSEKKTIEIRYQKLKSSGHQFWVEDNGIGIDQKDWSRIFTIFKRLHKKEDFEGGTGAGLTIAKKAVDRMGGRLWVESSRIAAGTVMTFTIYENAGDSLSIL